MQQDRFEKRGEKNRAKNNNITDRKREKGVGGKKDFPKRAIATLLYFYCLKKKFFKKQFCKHIKTEMARSRWISAILSSYLYTFYITPANDLFYLFFLIFLYLLYGIYPVFNDSLTTWGSFEIRFFVRYIYNEAGL